MRIDSRRRNALGAVLILIAACKDPKAPVQPESTTVFRGSADGVKPEAQDPILGNIETGDMQVPNPTGEMRNEGTQGVPAGDNSSGTTPPDSNGGGGTTPTPSPSPTTPPSPTPPAPAPFYPANCAEIKKAQPEAMSGPYKIYLNAASADRVALQAYCDMKEDGGGWTLVLNYLHRGGTNPPLKLLTDQMPLLGSDTLGVDESQKPNVWGHATPALLTKLEWKELRFYCVSSENTRILHIKTSEPQCTAAARTGTGHCQNLSSSFMTLSQHSASIPNRVNQGTQNGGDFALTSDVFGRGAVGADVMWSIRGSNDEDTWECDYGSNNDSNSTLHRVFIR